MFKSEKGSVNTNYWWASYV